MMSNEAVVELRGLEKAYGPVQALRGFDLHVPTGQVVGVLGPNGAGKTTALKILTGSLAADRGTARIAGHDVEEEPLGARAALGYLPENNPLYCELTVAAFLRWAAGARGLRGAAARAAEDRVVASTGLEAVWNRPLGECSKGFRQRVGLAQALLHDPPLLVLDEPTNGLDPLQVVGMRKLIRELGRTKTVLLTSHVLPEVESLAERVVLIHQGRKLADAPLAQLIASEEGEGLLLRVAARASVVDLRTLLEDAGAEVLAERPHPFGDSAYAAFEVRLAGGPAALEALGGAFARSELPLLQLAPQAGDLESVFRRLTAEGPER